MKDKNDPLNIFNELKQVDLKNVDFFQTLDDKQQKQLQPYTLMRWLSGCEGPYKYFVLRMVNDFVNNNYSLIKTEDKELLWKLLCLCGTEEVNKYSWIKPPNKRITKTPKLDALILDENPDISEKELVIIKNSFTEDKIEEYCKLQGFQDKEIKEYVTEYKKYKRN